MSDEKKTNVSIKIFTEESKRKVTNLIQECLGIQIISENGSLEIIGSMENPTISAIIDSIIKNRMVSTLDIRGQEIEEKLPETKKDKIKTEEKISEVKGSSEEIKVDTKDVDRPIETEEAKSETIEDKSTNVEPIKAEGDKDVEAELQKDQKATKETTITELQKKVLQYIEKNTEVKTKEIFKETGLKYATLKYSLISLEEKGKIEKVSRGLWRIKPDENESTTSTTDTKNEETDQINIVEKGPPVDEKDISDKIFKDIQRGWRVNLEELAEKFKIPKDIVEKVLIELQEKDKRIIRSDNEYYIPPSPFKFFDDETYKDLLDYIMYGCEFSEDAIIRKFPDKKDEISELMMKLQPKYIKPKMDSLDNRYVVRTKASILYFVKNHPNCTKKRIITCLFNMNPVEIKIEIKNAIARGELQYDKKSQTYIALNM